MNHPTDLPASSFFSHSPAIVGSAALPGRAALVNATTPAMSNIEIRVFKAQSPLGGLDRHRATICPFQGAPRQRVRLRHAERRDSVAIPAMVRKNLASDSDSTAFACRGAGPQVMNSTARLAANTERVVDC